MQSVSRRRLEARDSSGVELQASLSGDAKRMAPLVKKLGIGQN